MPTTATDGPNPHAKHVPGYTGFVPGVQAENLYGKTYGHASCMALAGDHTRFQWKEQSAADRFASSQKEEMLDFGHPAKVRARPAGTAAGIAVALRFARHCDPCPSPTCAPFLPFAD
jgi:hypothetical protein